MWKQKHRAGNWPGKWYGAFIPEDKRLEFSQPSPVLVKFNLYGPVSFSGGKVKGRTLIVSFSCKIPYLAHTEGEVIELGRISKFSDF